MKYINQLEYPHIPYRTRTKDDSVKDKTNDVAKSGCGLCSVCMILEHLIDVDLSIEFEGVTQNGAQYTVGDGKSTITVATDSDFRIIPFEETK